MFINFLIVREDWSERKALCFVPLKFSFNKAKLNVSSNLTLAEYIRFLEEPAIKYDE